MNAFEVLGIDAGASEKEIKKAYFKAVRQYPPDKEPERFKEIRAAYETLCDSDKKKKAEDLAKVPPEVRKLIEASERAMQQDDTEEAMACLDAAIHIAPDNLTVIELIGNLHMANGKTGLAVSHYEKYLQKFPGNLALSSRLAVAYWQRSWNKKAKAQFLYTISHGYVDPEFLEEFADYCSTENELALFEDTFFAVLETLTVGETGTAVAVTCISQLYINASDLRKHYLNSRVTTDWIRAYLQQRPELCTTGFFTELLNALSGSMQDADLYQLACDLPNLTVSLIPAAARDFAFGRARYSFEMAAFYNYCYPLVQRDLGAVTLYMYALAIYSREFETRSSYGDYYLPEKSFDVFDAQMSVIEAYRKHRTSFRVLIEQYPFIWSFMDEFITKLQSATNLNKFAERHAVVLFRSASPELKKILKEQLPPEAFEYYQQAASAPAPVKSKKIPPNSPCPCGSGKKYKKCCGKLS